ncbi:hypothetical protein BDQ17DRAFT_1366324 [Cyathus striatus]|nr:hypothetical protein BDQ17DRAFT_1366324 [Cyathus striatus]
MPPVYLHSLFSYTRILVSLGGSICFLSSTCIGLSYLSNTCVTVTQLNEKETRTERRPGTFSSHPIREAHISPAPARPSAFAWPRTRTSFGR